MKSLPEMIRYEIGTATLTVITIALENNTQATMSVRHSKAC